MVNLGDSIRLGLTDLSLAKPRVRRLLNLVSDCSGMKLRRLLSLRLVPSEGLCHQPSARSNVA